jgi:hypothetical protein
MSNENTPKDAAQPSETPATRKVLLGKKTVRHFAVKTNIQTGNTSTNTNCVNQTVKGTVVVNTTGVRC